MKNIIFEQMQEIIKNKDLHGTIILVDDESDRGIGKTYNADLISRVYNTTLVKKYNHPKHAIKLSVNEYFHRGKLLKPDDIYVLDEGYTLDEVNMLKKYYNIAFAVVNIRHISGMVKIAKN